MNYDFDLFVLGGGSGGIATARRAAEYGAKVGLAECDRLGGTCVNRGCIPKKLMVYASNFPELFQDAQGYGWSEIHSTFDWKKLIVAVDRELERLNGVYARLLDRSRVALYRTYGRFLDPHTIEVGDEKVTANKILIAVGGHPVKPEIPGMEYMMISDEMFYLDKQPQRIAIVGGGYIGVEFACIMNGLGSEVTQIIRKDLILDGFDDDLRTSIQEGMQHHGIRFVTGSTIAKIEKTDDGLKVSLNSDDQQDVVLADAVGLAATGRQPNLESLGLENAGVDTDRGAVAVNQWSQTNQEHIFAVGDCTNRVNLTPVAIDEGRAFADTVFNGRDRHTTYDNIPTAVFSTPEAATVGLTEAEARQQYGEALKVYKSRFKSTYHSLSGRDERTMMKLIVHHETDRVLGAHMVGEHAAEVIQGVAIALKMGAKKADFDATIGIHPTAAEEFVTMR
ncbi:MAG: glutathione-disulfide reductase [Cyanophyceae cyanobacterium]